MKRFGLSISAWAVDMEGDLGAGHLNDSANLDAMEAVTSELYSAPPELEPSDYIEIGLLTSMVIVGGPLNLVSLFRSLRANLVDVLRCCVRTATAPCGFRGSRRANERETGCCYRPLTLRFHLTVANLLVLWVYSVSEICWLCTYSWRGGDLLCRAVRFVHAFCFYATSNLVAAIGIDRLHVTVYVDRPNVRSASGRPRTRSNVLWLASVAWTIAFLSSIPQLFIWGTFEPFPHWAQCSTIWTIAKYEQLTAGNETNEAHQLKLHYEEKLYDGLHLALVFWIPAIFITVTYTSIVTRFSWNIRKTSAQHCTTAPEIARKRQPLGEPREYDSSSLVGRSSFVAKTPPMLNAAATDWDATWNSLQASPSSSLLQRQGLARMDTDKTRRRSRFAKQADRKVTTASLDPGEINRTVEEDISSAYEYSAMLQPTETTQPAKTANRASSGGSFAVVTLTRAKRRTVRKTVWILLAYFILWSPYNFLALYRYFYPTFEHSYLEIMYNLIVLNAVVNPMIYGV